MKTKNTKKYWLIGAIVVVALALVFYLSHSMKQNGGSLTPPKKISFVKQAKGSGTHIWFETMADDEDSPTGLSKDSPIAEVMVLKNNKIMKLRILDKFTLGKASKMSDKQIIAYAQNQNKKYFYDVENEVKNWKKNNDVDRIFASFNNDDLQMYLKNGPEFHFRVTEGTADSADIKDPRMINFKEWKKIKNSSNYNILDRKYYVGSDSALIGSYIDRDHTFEGQDLARNIDKEIINNRVKGLFYNIDHTKYVEPIWSPIEVKNTTDASGNKVCLQKVYFQSIVNFKDTDSDTMTKNIDTLSKSKKKQIIDLLNNPAKSPKARYEAVNKVFDKSYYRHITKNFFNPKPQAYYIKLNSKDTVKQRIYDSDFIGYRIYSRVCLVTKAQTKDQTVTVGD